MIFGQRARVGRNTLMLDINDIDCEVDVQNLLLSGSLINVEKRLTVTIVAEGYV